MLFVGRTRYRLPLDGTLAAKWDALWTSGGARDRERHRPRPALSALRPRPMDGPRFYAALPVRVSRELRSFRRTWSCREPVRGGRRSSSRADAVAGEARRRGARRLAHLHPPLRLAGARGARAGRRPARDLGGPARRRPSRGLRVHRLVPPRARGRPGGSSPRTPTSARSPAPSRGCRRSRSRSSSACSSATRTSRASRRRGGRSRARLPDARLHVDGLRAPRPTSWSARGPAGSTLGPAPARAARRSRSALDEARTLVLPSESEGLPRVVVEAFMRGRSGRRDSAPRHPRDRGGTG